MGHPLLLQIIQGKIQKTFILVEDCIFKFTVFRKSYNDAFGAEESPFS